MNRAGPAAPTESGSSALWRIAGVFFILAALVAAPFLIWGEQFDALFRQDRLLGWFDDYRATAWIAAIALLVSDLALPIPNTMVMAALGLVYGPFWAARSRRQAVACRACWDMRSAGVSGVRSRDGC